MRLQHKPKPPKRQTMAYINSDQVKKIRTALKKNFPQFKLSVTKHHCSGVNITILAGPTNFGCEEYTQLNYFNLEKYADGNILVKMRKLVHETVANHDNSDHMTDYFDVGYYEHWSVGNWNKPFTLTEGFWGY